jgi:hypothetical protein
VQAPVACLGSLHETRKNYWTEGSLSIAPVQERGWHPDDYRLFQKSFPRKTSLLWAALPEIPLVRERSKIVRG